MNVVDLITRSRRHPLDQRFAMLVMAKMWFKPNSIDMKHLLEELKIVQNKRLKRDARAA